jgi:uncharacterized protein YlbG (UPF0298 family)
MSLGVFQSNGNESRKIFIFAALTFISLIFRYEILYAIYVELLDKLKEVKKSQFFSSVKRSGQNQTASLLKTRKFHHRIV